MVKPTAMSPSVTSTSTYTRSERVLLTGVPPEHRAHLLRLLRSPDRVVRDMAVLLVFLDRSAPPRGPGG
jgi:hypothetical protein